jgi:hypothetical protein
MFCIFVKFSKLRIHILKCLERERERERERIGPLYPLFKIVLTDDKLRKPFSCKFIQKLLYEVAVAFNSTFRYIDDDVLSIKNNQFHSYVDSIYPNELDIKDTTECSTSSIIEIGH